MFWTICVFLYIAYNFRHKFQTIIVFMFVFFDILRHKWHNFSSDYEWQMAANNDATDPKTESWSFLL